MWATITRNYTTTDNLATNKKGKKNLHVLGNHMDGFFF